MTEGHAQELKTQALALQVGKRLRVILSDNNAGIDDKLLGRRGRGSDFAGYRSGGSMDVLWLERDRPGGWRRLWRKSFRRFDAMEKSDATDRRPMILIAKTTKGYWPAAADGMLDGGAKQIVSYQSHPYGQKMNSDYFVALASTFEKRFGVSFEGIRDGAVTDERDSG